MKTYLIDGNNLIGKIIGLQSIHQKDKQGSREILTQIIDRYFFNKKNKVILFFDGFSNIPIGLSRGKIIYSESKPADNLIKQQISDFKNPKNLIVVSSDNEVKQFARVCSCTVITSEEFSRILNDQKSDEEKLKQDEIKNIEEWKKIFNVK